MGALSKIILIQVLVVILIIILIHINLFQKFYLLTPYPITESQ